MSETIQEDHATSVESGAARARTPRRVSNYDLPTPLKRAFGARLAEARRIAGLSLTEAADQLGYSQPVQLSLMETGNRMPTLDVLIRCSVMYGTTADFLCGLAADSDRDPVAGIHRHVAGQVTSEVRRLIAALADVSVGAVRDLRPDAGRMLRLASLVVESSRALGRVRELQPEFDDEVRGAASLVCKLDLAVELAREHLESVARAQRLMAAGPVDLGTVAGIELEAGSDEVLRWSLAPTVRQQPNAEEDLEDV